MIRHFDETGVSGTGVVLEGCIFDSGQVVVHWFGGTAGCSSIGIYNSYDDFLNIHVRSHPSNKTQIRWL